MKKNLLFFSTALLLAAASPACAFEIGGKWIEPQYLGIAVFVAFLIALLICLKFKNDMKTAREAHDANGYLDGSSVEFYVRDDRYTHTTEVRQPLPQQKKE